MNHTHKKSLYASVVNYCKKLLYTHGGKLSFAALWCAIFTVMTSDNKYILATAVSLLVPLSSYFVGKFRYYCFMSEYRTSKGYFNWPEDSIGYSLLNSKKPDFSFREDNKKEFNFNKEFYHNHYSSCCKQGGVKSEEDKVRDSLYKGEG